MNRPLTQERVIAPGASSVLDAVLQRHGLGKRVVLVCDDATWVAAGQRAQAELHKAGGYEVLPYSLGRQVKPLLSHATELAANAQTYDTLVAIGSGTVNDITKYAAALLRKPYVSVPTAASMNGYTSAGASLIDHGHKHSHPALPPCAVVVDLDVIAAAPKRMTRAGLGDTLCRSTVEVDMLLAYHLLDQPYPRIWFNAMRVHESQLIAHAGKLREGDGAFLALLMTALLDGGDAMADTGSSAVASQGEHMITHTAELMYGAELSRVMHGELVAVTTLSMGHLQQKLLLSSPSVKPLPQDYDKFPRIFGKDAGGKIAAAYAAKVLSPEQAEAMNGRFAARWPQMKEEMQQIMLSPNTVERAFMQAGVPTKPGDIGLSDERYVNACNHAYMTRDRFTFLEIAAMMNRRF